MTTLPATLSDLALALDACPPDLPVKLRTQSGVIGAGYHVTELKLAQIQSIDCAGRLSTWEESLIQVLDAEDGDPLVAGKVAAILRRSAAALPDLADAPMAYELSPGNLGLARYHLTGLSMDGDSLLLDLGSDRAQCKPATDMACQAPEPAAARGCCG